MLHTSPRGWLAKDLVAGLVLTTILVPAGMGYAEAAGLPAIYGLYATIVPLVAYALFGPSRILVLGPDSALAGIIAALFSMFQVAGNIATAPLLKFFKRRLRLLTFAFAIQALAILGVGLFQFFYPSVALFLCFAFAAGLAMPVKQAWLHEIIPSEQRASIVSFDSLVGSVGSVGGQVGYGYLADRVSISAGYIVGGLINLLVLIPLFSLRKDEEDKSLLDQDLVEPEMLTPETEKDPAETGH